MIIIKINGVEYRALKSSQLLTKCKKIFGAVLEAAYVVDKYTLEGGWSSEEESAKYLKTSDDYLSALDNAIKVDFGDDELILQFKGGNCVLLSASEWASFEKVDVEDA